MSEGSGDRRSVQTAVEQAVLAAGAVDSVFAHRPTEDGTGWIIDWEGVLDGEAADLCVIGSDQDHPVHFFLDAWHFEGVAKSDLPALITAAFGSGGARIVTSGRLLWKGTELIVPLPSGEARTSIRNPSDGRPSPWEERAAAP